MNFFLQITLILIQWVSGICIFMLCYIALFKKYQNPKSHIFTIYYTIIGFSLISDIIINLVPGLTPYVRFTLFFIKDPLSIIVLAFFISFLVLKKNPDIRYTIISIVLLVINFIPHLPYHGEQVYNNDYPLYGLSIIGTFVFIVLAVIKTIRDYGESKGHEVPKGLWWFLSISFIHKASALIFSSLGYLSFEFNTFSAISMIMMIVSFFLLIKVFYETIIKSRDTIGATISKTELLEKKEGDLIHFMASRHPQVIKYFSEFSLSDRELALVFFTMMGVSLKESANYFNVSVKTIEQYRYRVKKKIGLESSLSRTLMSMKFEAI